MLIIKIALAAIFTLSVVSKLTGKTKSTFDDAGYSPVIMYGTAIAEMLFTIGLFTRYDFLSAAGLLSIMAGAMVTLFRQRVSPSKYALALIAIALLGVLLVLLISGSSSFA